jgi:hypothetical protein
MNWEPLANWLAETSLHDVMVNYSWMFPMMETFHFLGLTVLFGALLLVDLRVIGLIRFINMDEAMKYYIPLAIGAFAVNLLSGIAFLAADPYAYFPNLGFQWKMGMIAIAGINALWFWIGEHKELKQLADGQDAPFRAKIIALASIVIWITVIVLGRMIPYLEF